MPKRRDLIRKIEKQARSQGVAFGELREGSKHTIYTLDGVRLAKVALSGRPFRAENGAAAAR